MNAATTVTVVDAPYQPRYSLTPPLSLEEQLDQLEQQFPGVVFWWGRATREWWALIGTCGYEADTLDELLVNVRAALTDTRPLAAVTHPTHSGQYQALPAVNASRPRAPGPAWRPAPPPPPPPQAADLRAHQRPGVLRRVAAGVRWFFIAEEAESW